MAARLAAGRSQGSLVPPRPLSGYSPEIPVRPTSPSTPLCSRDLAAATRQSLPSFWSGDMSDFSELSDSSHRLHHESAAAAALDRRCAPTLTPVAARRRGG